MPELCIQITKRADGSVVLRCERADGSVTWQRQEGRQAMFFPLHDLTHYAVETELGFREGFYGLLASGWDVGDTEGKGSRGALPLDAVGVERFVGMLDAERASGAEWSAADFNEQIAVSSGPTETPRTLTDEELRRVRTSIRELFGKWGALPADQSLELPFDRPAG